MTHVHRLFVFSLLSVSFNHELLLLLFFIYCVFHCVEIICHLFLFTSLWFSQWWNRYNKYLYIEKQHYNVKKYHKYESWALDKFTVNKHAGQKHLSILTEKEPVNNFLFVWGVVEGCTRFFASQILSKIRPLAVRDSMDPRGRVRWSVNPGTDSE